MIRVASTEQLEKWLKESRMSAGLDFLLVNVLGEKDFKKGRIPNSVNVPVKRTRFENEVERLAGGKAKPIVVYCAGAECEASGRAARRLKLAGFSHVYDYAGGMKSWIEAGHEVAREEISVGV